MSLAVLSFTEMDVYEKAKTRRLDAPEWKKQLVKELLKPKKIRFKRRKVYSPSVDDTWTADLADFHKYSRQNRGYNFILVVLDVFSRYAWARPLKNKTGVQCANAFEDILIKSGRKPKRLWCDRGTEFYNVNFRQILEDNDIQLYSTYNEPKATIAERFIRTLRSKIESNYILTQQTVWYDILPQLVHEYNNTRHRTIKRTPEQACKPENFRRVYRALYKEYDKRNEQNEPLFNVGDKVRISVYKGLFEKGATANWSEEIYKVSEINPTNPVTYRLVDLMDEDLDGAFYNEQLEKTDLDIYRIDKVLRRRTKADGTREARVRWCGYPDKFNEWISDDVIRVNGQEIAN